MPPSTLRADLDAAAAEQREAPSLRARLALVTSERDKLRAQLELIETASLASVRVPRWLTPKKRSRTHEATLCLLVTDTHFDEVVDPAEVGGLNAYNREIAGLRLRRGFERALHLARHYLTGVRYNGVVLFLGGDLFSGNIHEELQRTNADTLFGSLLHWIGPMVAGVKLLADAVGRVHVAGVPGNHGRMTRKPIAKKRAADNLDWLLYRLMAREMADDTRITFTVPESADARVSIYNTRFLLTHGDQFRGGSGIAGAMSPLLLGAHRKTRRQITAGQPYDVMVMGHWHTSVWLPYSKGLIVGPCLKGYDEYAYVSNFDYEPPAQTMWVTTPEHGITFHAPIFVQERATEGW